MGMLDVLDVVSVDWSDFEKAGALTRELAHDLVHDKPALRTLVRAVGDSPARLAMCERHKLLDYLVLYDALDRGFRIRLHVSTSEHLDRPHDHRFSFSTYLATGEYEHTWYHCAADIYADPDDAVRGYQSADEPDPRNTALLHSLTPHLVRVERAGDAYSLHHSALHTTFTTPDTVSLFVRGPAEKSRSVIMDKDASSAWWRFGRAAETPQRRQQKQMTYDDYAALCSRLADLGVL